MAQQLDSTMEHDVQPGGSKTSQGSNQYDSTMTSPFSPPSASGGEGQGAHKLPVVGKPQDAGIITFKFYESVPGSPGSLDSTLDDVFQISFNK